MNKKQITAIIISILFITLGVLGVLFALILPKSNPNRQSNYNIWFEGPNVRIQRDASTRNQTSYELLAARGEYEPFQIIIKATKANLRNVTITISDFSNRVNSISSKENVEFFYEHYIQVVNSSYRSPFTPRKYPDALIPFFDPETGEDIINARFDGYPFSVNKGDCQPIWVDVFIPQNALPGSYQSTITVDAIANETGLSHKESITIDLHIKDFIIPEKLSMRSAFGIYSSTIWNYYNFNETPTDRETFQRILDKYRDELIRHHLMPFKVHENCVKPLANGSPDWSDEPNYSQWVNQLEHWFLDQHINSIDFPKNPLLDIIYDPLDSQRSTVKNWVNGIYDFFKSRSWEDSLYIYLLDEPNSKIAYDLIRNWSSLIREANEDIRILVTEQFKPDNSSWGSLKGYVDLWCPLWGTFNESEVSERLAAGDEIWSYTALVQSNYTPIWLLDFPLINYRIATWLNEHYQVSGLLEWCTNYWPENYDPWLETESYNFLPNLVYNKEGDLFYPGLDIGTEIPAASIRLKLIRESVEDYEYFQILKQTGLTNQCKSLIDSIAPNWYSWCDQTETMMKAREEIANLIENHSNNLNLKLIEKKSVPNPFIIRHEIPCYLNTKIGNLLMTLVILKPNKKFRK
jgi:hypothetical protein